MPLQLGIKKQKTSFIPHASSTITPPSSPTHSRHIVPTGQSTTPVTPPLTTPTPSNPSKHRSTFSPGELGKLASLAAKDLKRFGWPGFVSSQQIFSSVNTGFYHLLHHPAIPYLYRLATRGVPAPSASPPWSWSKKRAAYNRGPHTSAARIHAPFLLEDMYQMVQDGYWAVLPFSAVS
jgi:hypothetical protein